MYTALYSQDSRLPKEAFNWLQNSSWDTAGDVDGINVIFFEVPDTVTGTLYFGVNNPGNNDGGIAPDDWWAGVPGRTFFYLVGGAGTLSSSTSRQIQYGNINDAITGTVLDSYYKEGENENWIYFNGVSPSQGEHIGNKYYFKIVVDTKHTASSGGVYKNAYQVDISYSNSGIPTSISGVKTFAYNWCMALLNDLNTWNIYPFVPNAATGNIVFYNWDFDQGETGEIYDITGDPRGTFTSTADAVLESASSVLIIPEDTNGTWNYRIVENANPPTLPINTSEVYFYNDGLGEYLRGYSSHYVPPTPDHVELTWEDGIAIANGADTEKITLQIADADGTPLPYVQDIYVVVDGNASITQSNNGAVGAPNTVVTTTSDGLAWILVTDGTAETVNVTVLTDGTSGSDNFGAGADEGTTIDFQANPDPALSSSANKSFGKGDGSTAISTLNITNSPVATKITAANDIYIQIPAGLDCVFDPAFNTPAFGGSAGGDVAATVTFTGGNKIAVINVTSGFTTGALLTIDGLQFISFNSESTGQLLLSYDSGISYPVMDDKVYSIVDNTPPTITARQTADLDGNGLIDAIHITFSKNIDDTTVVAGNFDVDVVAGEAFSSTTNGDTPNDNDIYITFTEDPTQGTDAVPDVTYTLGSLTDLSGNNLASTGAVTPTDAAPAAITASTLAADNTYIDITFSEGVFGNAGGTLPVDITDFNLTFAQNGGSATNVTINSLTTTLGAVLTGGETTVRVRLTITGTPSGVETIAVTPVIGTAIYEAQGNATPVTVTTGNVTLNNLLTAPVISDTRAVPGSRAIYIEFTMSVRDVSDAPLSAANFTYTNNYDAAAVTVTSLVDVSGSGTPASKFLLYTDLIQTDEHIVADRITPANIENYSDTPLAAAAQRVSTIGINFFTNLKMADFVHSGRDWEVTLFDGSKSISPQAVTVFADVDVNYTGYTGTPELYYALFSSKEEALFWDPAVNSDDHMVTGTLAGGNSWSFYIGSDTAELKNGYYLSFVFKIGDYYCYSSKYAKDDPGFTPAEAVAPVVKIESVREQNTNVTILNNVINPTRGEATRLIYTLQSAGPVSIIVYDLSSNVVDVLVTETQRTGTYYVSWDGKNQNGKIVTRGVYFIRVRAPGIFNQIRKVLIEK